MGAAGGAPTGTAHPSVGFAGGGLGGFCLSTWWQLEQAQRAVCACRSRCRRSRWAECGRPRGQGVGGAWAAFAVHPPSIPCPRPNRAVRASTRCRRHCPRARSCRPAHAVRGRARCAEAHGAPQMVFRAGLPAVRRRVTAPQSRTAPAARCAVIGCCCTHPRRLRRDSAGGALPAPATDSARRSWGAAPYPAPVRYCVTLS